MAFLRQKNVEFTDSASEKFFAEFWNAPKPNQITVLTYVIKSTKKSRHGEILSEKYDFFGWGAHWKSDIPEEALWEMKGCKFAIQDGRWDQQSKLLLDVVDEQFKIRPHMTY